MGTNDKISQLCRMTKLTSRMWRGITLSKMENSVRSTKPPNNFTHFFTDECCRSSFTPGTVLLWQKQFQFPKCFLWKHHGNEQCLFTYCNTPQSETFQIGPVIYTRTLKWLSSTYAYPPTCKGVLRRNVSFVFKLYIY